MNKKNIIAFCIVFLLLCICNNYTIAQNRHTITYCGEAVPMDDEFVSEKLMNVIRKQIPNVNLPALRQRANSFFPIVEQYLKQHGLPQDLKYIAIVESGFVSSAISHAGARGFWQIMPATAKHYGLNIEGEKDDRDDIYKSSSVACKLLKDNYNYLLKRYTLASWSLSSAAYNFGIGNISKAIDAQGTNYFLMNLNQETSLYVYKIIAVKELFEYPEIYMKNFGYNVFNANSKKSKKTINDDEDDNSADFKSLTLKGKTNNAPKETKFKYLMAHIKGTYKNFKDGDFITIELDESLTTSYSFSKKGFSFKVQGWVIDDRVFLDLGYGHEVVLCDLDQKRGLDINALNQKNADILLKVTLFEE